MNRTLLAIACLLCSIASYSQNYQCLQAGVKRYYLNDNHYLRGMTIDSTRAYTDSTIYYPFHTPRGRYDVVTPFSFPTLDPNGGSWLGKKVIGRSNGTFIFDNYWGDSVIIETQAHTGDSWLFYTDSGSLYYRATLTATDTMTVLAAPDSVKRITIRAYNSMGRVTTDPLDSFEIILSKNHGFVQVFDLYTFPYHEPDSVYKVGLDFFLDRSTCDVANINGFIGPAVAPNRSITLFRLIDFINPNEQEIYNWQVGDIIESMHESGTVFPDMNYYFLTNSVASRTGPGVAVDMYLSGTGITCSHLWSTCELICNGGGITLYNNRYPLAPIGFMPESKYGSWQTDNYVFYYPDDTSYCKVSPAYKTLGMNYNPWGLGWTHISRNYKLGVGKTEFRFYDGEPSVEYSIMRYYKIGGVECGKSTRSTSISLPANIGIEVTPNPASDVVAIKTTYVGNSIIQITDAVGQVVISQACHGGEALLSVGDIPSGLYYVNIIAVGESKRTTKLVISH